MLATAGCLVLNGMHIDVTCTARLETKYSKHTTQYRDEVDLLFVTRRPNPTRPDLTQSAAG